MTRLLRLALILVIAVAVAVVIGTGVGLPPEVASHFGRSGAADGWMSRPAYLAVMVALVVLAPLATAATAGLVPRWTRRSRLMRDPEYWLAPPRRAATDAFREGHACALGIALCLFLAGMHLLVIEANATVPPHLPLPHFFALLGAFLACTGLLLAVLFLRFRTPG